MNNMVQCYGDKCHFKQVHTYVPKIGAKYRYVAI